MAPNRPTAKVASLMISKPGSWNAPAINRAASMTRDRLKQLITICAGRRRCHAGNARHRRQSKHHADQCESTERQQLHVLHTSAAACWLDDCQQVTIVEAAQHQDHDLKAYRRDISDDHHHSLGSPSSRPVG